MKTESILAKAWEIHQDKHTKGFLIYCLIQIALIWCNLTTEMGNRDANNKVYPKRSGRMGKVHI